MSTFRSSRYKSSSSASSKLLDRLTRGALGSLISVTVFAKGIVRASLLCTISGSCCFWSWMIGGAFSPTHPRHMFTAFSHIANDLALSSRLTCGSKTAPPARFISRNSAKLRQSPAARPAAIAAPRAVVSRIFGRYTGIEMRSAWIYWRHRVSMKLFLGKYRLFMSAYLHG